ncbi:Guanine nucleotide exchange factor (GEF) which may activate RAB8A and RAB8B [Mortierella sp. AD094]|nr:Guanine nucleotide exchange factor (GEF) which may activate RAB8A and RAB8B [Mortierella sp. AD094]
MIPSSSYVRNTMPASFQPGEQPLDIVAPTPRPPHSPSWLNPSEALEGSLQSASNTIAAEEDQEEDLPPLRFGRGERPDAEDEPESEDELMPRGGRSVGYQEPTLNLSKPTSPTILKQLQAVSLQDNIHHNSPPTSLPTETHSSSVTHLSEYQHNRQQLPAPTSKAMSPPVTRLAEVNSGEIPFGAGGSPDFSNDLSSAMDSENTDATVADITTDIPTGSTFTNTANHADKDNSMPTTNEEDNTIGECPCHKISSGFVKSTCGICHRTIPALAESDAEFTRLTDDLEQLKRRLEDEQKQTTSEAAELQRLQKKVQDLESALAAKTDDHISVQRDMTILNDKYVDEIEKVAEMQHAKEMVENELEELSRTLFEEANGMVATEARARHQLELTRKHLELELKDAQERLAAETSQLKELKTKMEAMMELSPQSKRSSVNPVDRGSVDLAQLFGLSKVSDPVPQPQEPETAIAIDGHLIQEFKEFVTQSSTVRLAKIHGLPFMRHCQDEDVEPCLRFGSSPRVSAKRLTEGICSNTCYIEEATQEQVKEYERMIQAAQQPPSPARNSMSNKNMLWERLQTQYAMYQAPKGGCQTCGRQGPLSHRYRIAASDEWSFIDRFCRDRLVAVCEFYIFIRNIRSGLYANRAIEDLYSECLRLRLQMFYARSGVLPIMLAELGVDSKSIGNMGPSGEWPEGIQLHGDTSETASIASSTPISTPKTERVGFMSRPQSFGAIDEDDTITNVDEAAEPIDAISRPTTMDETLERVTSESPPTSTLASAGPESTIPSTLVERETPA